MSPLITTTTTTTTTIKIPTKYISFHPCAEKGYYIRIYVPTETEEEELIFIRQYLQNQLNDNNYDSE